MMKVAQSDRLRGEKIFMPTGQLFFWVERDTVRHCSHLTSMPAEYLPESVTGEHLHEVGLPGFGFTKILSF
jgi:hypothetical protein